MPPLALCSATPGESYELSDLLVETSQSQQCFRLVFLHANYSMY